MLFIPSFSGNCFSSEVLGRRDLAFLISPDFGVHKIASIAKIKKKYSKVSIIRPGRSRLLEFEKKIVLVV